MKRLIPLALSLTLIPLPAVAAELLANPREFVVQRLIRGQATTLVIADEVNVRTLPSLEGNGTLVFAQLSQGDEVYVLECTRVAYERMWVRVYIPELKEMGYVSAEFLQNNFNQICARR